MKKSELTQIIREEIQRIVREAKIAPPLKELCNKAADALEKAAKKEHDRNMKIWTKDGDEEMIKMTKNDLADHLSIVKLIRSGKMKQAADAASYLDTGSRDVIPVKVYDFIMKHGD